jgi:hypothetical protein
VANGFKLADEACKEALNDVALFREYCGFDLVQERTYPSRTHDEISDTSSKAAMKNKQTMDGNKLHQAIIDEAGAELKAMKSTLEMPENCFIGGTLVHTKEGLRPIEDIQVGDYVLSKPESGEGEQAYKRVTRTIKHENKAVWRVSCHKKEGDNHVYQRLIVTGNHPFYVVGQRREEWWEQERWDELPKYAGWRRADLLMNYDLVLLANGETISVSFVDQIWRTKQEGIGWIGGAPDTELGHLIELRDGRIPENFSDWIHYGDCVYTDVVDAIPFGIRYETPEAADDWAYKCDVYNIEVEDFHTYYVGEEGVWGHNTNCFENSLKPLKRGKGRAATSPDLAGVDRACLPDIGPSRMRHHLTRDRRQGTVKPIGVSCLSSPEKTLLMPGKYARPAFLNVYEKPSRSLDAVPSPPTPLPQAGEGRFQRTENRPGEETTSRNRG